jgi:hypothetical protein
MRHFRQRTVQFLWLVHPTDQPANLAEQLAARGMPLAEHATGMSLDLTSWSASPAHRRGPSPIERCMTNRACAPSKS